MDPAEAGNSLDHVDFNTILIFRIHCIHMSYRVDALSDAGAVCRTLLYGRDDLTDYF